MAMNQESMVDMSISLLQISTKEDIFIDMTLDQIEAYSTETYLHCVRVGDLAARIAREIGLTTNRVELLRVCGLMHDIGKLTIPIEILSKSSQLTPLEYKIIKKHTLEGYWMAKDNLPDTVAKAILLHHERLDGSGYPFGLMGDQIPLEARIVMLADCYDAMTFNRSYKKAISSVQALDELSTMLKCYDPDIFDVLKDIVKCA